MAEITTTLYDFNKINMLSIPPLEEKNLDKILARLSLTMTKNGKYWMMLSNEKHYYTVFNLQDANVSQVHKSLENVLNALDDDVSIIDIFKQDEKEDKVWEIWTKQKNEKGEDEAYMYMLFEYSWGVEDCCEEKING